MHVGIGTGFFPHNMVTTGNLPQILPELAVVQYFAFVLNSKVSAITADNQAMV